MSCSSTLNFSRLIRKWKEVEYSYDFPNCVSRPFRMVYENKFFASSFEGLKTKVKTNPLLKRYMETYKENEVQQCRNFVLLDEYMLALQLNHEIHLVKVVGDKSYYAHVWSLDVFFVGPKKWYSVRPVSGETIFNTMCNDEYNVKSMQVETP